MTFNLAGYKNEIGSLCTIYGVERLELFGSAARSDFDLEKSDLDFLVVFSKPHALGAFERYFGLKEGLEDLLQRPVDLVELKAIRNPYFRQSIENDKVMIYG